MQFPEPHHKCQCLQQLFLQQQGRKRTATWNRGIRPINGFDVHARHERTHSRITRKSSLWSPQAVQVADVILAISKLKNTKSTGHDQINLQHIKESLMVTIPNITLIINTSIVTKVFPKPWKHSISYNTNIKIRWYWRTDKFQTI